MTRSWPILRASWPFLLCILGGYLGFLVYPGESWWVTPFSTWQWLGVPVLLVGPLYAAWAAWWVQKVARLVEAGAWRLGGRGREVALVFGPLLAAVVGIHLVATTVALALSASRRGGLDISLAWMLIPQIITLAMCAAFGAALGSRWRSSFAAPAAALVLFLIPAALFGRVLSKLIVVGGGQAAIGSAPDWRYFLAQTGWALGLFLTLLALVSAHRSRIRPDLPVAVGGVATAIISAVVLLQPGLMPLAPGSGVTLDCDDGAPRLCLAVAGGPLRDATRQAVDQIAGVSTVWGIPHPMMLAEAVPEQAPPGGAHRLAMTAAPGMTAADLLADLSFVLSFYGDESCLEDAPDDSQQFVLLAGQAVSEQARGVDSADPDIAHLRRSKVGQEWVAATLRSWSTCSLQAMGPPPDG